MSAENKTDAKDRDTLSKGAWDESGCEDWIRQHYVDQDISFFKELKGICKKGCRWLFLVKKFNQLKRDRRTIHDSNAFLRQHKDSTIVGLCEESEAEESAAQTKDERVAGQAKRSNLQCAEKKCVGRNQALQSRNKLTRRYAVNPWSRQCGRGVALPMSWMSWTQWVRAHVQVLPALVDAAQG